MNHTLNILLLGITVGILCHSANARTGGFVQSSYFSTNGGTASGAAESSVIGPDGVRKGECSYSNSNGETVKIKYEESSDGRLIKGSVNGKEEKGDIARVLGECRGAINILSGSVTRGIAQGVEETKERVSEFERTFEQQMENFNRQQEAFINEQSNFFKQMADFTRGFEDSWKF
ncbi:uncharacterized protein [Palaemon carinicauda]|uniref:uncharacterized protein isoform X2 n=1 Tax=Palaemon carinicauda TaxID=392227 RepID=UPI0035B5C645